MGFTTIPAALNLGATLLVETRAEQFEFANDHIQFLQCIAAQTDWDQRSIRVRK